MADKQPDLFELGRVDSPVKIHCKDPCTAGPIGSGPPGKNCGGCKFLVRYTRSKAYLKCGLMQRHITRGAATDIRARWPACRYWMPRKMPELTLPDGVRPDRMTADDWDVQADHEDDLGNSATAELIRLLRSYTVLGNANDLQNTAVRDRVTLD